MASEHSSQYWLRFYGNRELYQWRETSIDGLRAFCRPLGLVEFSFDSDGRYFEGRADMNNMIVAKMRSRLSRTAFRERMLLVWTSLRCRHSLLRARTIQKNSSTSAPHGQHFVVDVPEDVEVAKESARQHLIFLEDHFDKVDTMDFFYHCQNASRIIDPDVAMAKLFVLPVNVTDDPTTLRVLFVGSHEVWDGLTTHAWNRDFIQLLNDPPDVLVQKITAAIDPSALATALPLPQEALYPAISGSIARQRWFWAIVRILRHVRRPLRAGIINPIRRPGTLPAVQPLPPTFHPILSYAGLPTRNTQTFIAHIPHAGAARLHRICRATRASIGAGLFALVALVGMELHEAQNPSRSLSTSPSSSSAAPVEYPDFIASFPLDARAFVADAAAPESMMLAFSDGITLPFLPTTLGGVEARLRLLVRRAHTQLAAYQKRRRESAAQCLTARGAGLVLAAQYLASLERVENVLPPHLRTDDPGPQGATYPLRANATLATHGVSSVGRRDAILRRGEFGLELGGEEGVEGSKDLAVDFVDMGMGVRAREGEFLVGIGGYEDGIFATAIADTTAIDPVMAERWRVRLEHILDEDGEEDEAQKSKL